jgi:sugar phosphate isomerase/epimerase
VACAGSEEERFEHPMKPVDPSKVKPISLQLYTLRDQVKNDFVSVLKRVAQIGYKGVEPAGFHNLTAKEFKKIVTDLGMVFSSSHGSWGNPENINECVEIAGTLGLDMVCGGYGPDDFKTLDVIQRTAAKTNERCAALKKHGLGLFLHNHWWEFEVLDGRLKYDIFAELCPDVRFEIDTYWAANFGANDPAEQVAKFKSRTPLLHIKDGTFVKDVPHVAVGKGKMNFPKVVAAADPKVLRWLIVELDTCATDMFQAVADSYTYLTSSGLAVGNT